MLRSFVLLAGGLGFSTLGFFACSSSECSGAACEAPVVDAGPDIVDTGPVCAGDADPKNEPGCVNDEFGVFVDKDRGKDTNPGTKAAPFQTANAALGKIGDKKRVFLCEGNYFEHVTIAKEISLHGGFACETWKYNGSKARFAPNDYGYIVEVALVGAPIMITDLTLEAVPATAPGASSIAMFITRSAKVSLRRMSLSAGAGAPGTDAVDIVDYVPPSTIDGNPGTDPLLAGKGKANPSCNATIGGAGGKDGETNGRGGQVPLTPAFPEKSTGAGGMGALACDQGGVGLDGSFGLGGNKGAGAAVHGTLETTGWKGTNGAAGGKGGDGQGGGGGGQINPLGIGGSGGPGGCGGTGGGGGTAGGSSIALLIFDSTVSVEGSSLNANAGSKGGKGAKGQKAQLASTNTAGPSAEGEACSGGLGGAGGSGGGGGGGAGGLSVGILHKGPAPTIDGASTPDADTLASITIGAGGAGGASGAGGDPARTDEPATKPGAEGSAGVDGLAKAVVTVP